MTNLLLERLKGSATARVVTVSESLLTRAAVTGHGHRACLERHTRAWARSRPAVARVVRGQVQAARRMKARSSTSTPMERP